MGQLAELVGGRVDGDPAAVIRGAAPLGSVAAGEITLIDQPERVKQLAATQAAAVVVPEKLDWKLVVGGEASAQCATILVADVHAAFAKIVLHFRPPRRQPVIGIQPQAFVSRIGPLGKGRQHSCRRDGRRRLPDRRRHDDSARRSLAGRLHDRPRRDHRPRASCSTKTRSSATARSSTADVVLGAHGFGYSQVGGRHVPAAQLGYVRIGSDVEIGAGTTIDRGTYGATTIGDGTKIDNLVQIAHNCRIGRHNLICSQVGIAGSTTTGDYVVMGGQAGVRDHVHIGTGAMLERDGRHHERRAGRRP